MNDLSLPNCKLRVLVADDIEASRHALVELVQNLGHDCLQASSGKDAMDCIEGQNPDIVLLDLLMPDVDGFEVTRLVRQRVTDRWLPVIVMSSLAWGEAHFVRALSMGADDYLVRPVSPPILQAKLRQYHRVLALHSHLAMLAQRQRAIHEHIADAIITVDSMQQIVEANLAAKKLFGLAGADELTGQLLRDVLGIDLEDAMKSREMAFVQRNGQVTPLGVSASQWSIGTQAYCTIALHDLSEWRRMERMKDEFMATVSHELRTPLTSVLGALGLMAAGAAGALPATAQELIMVARRNGERLGRLIDDVLDLAKLEGNRMVLNMRPASIDTLLAEAVATNAPYAQRSGVTLELAPLAVKPSAMVDADRFLQVMANLLSNAIKHSHAGQKVQVALRGDPQGWRIDVVDHGPGIDPAFRARLFEKFAQADGSDRRVQGGTGLGLYISRMLIERMGGQILAHSDAGQGSTFSVVLPAHGANNAGPWVACIAQDRQHLDRLSEWLSPIVRVEAVADTDMALSLVARQGPPAAVIANPQAQGCADAFCLSLQGVAKAAKIVLVGDSIDADFARQQGMRWVPLADGARQRLVSGLQSILATSDGK